MCQTLRITQFDTTSTQRRHNVDIGAPALLQLRVADRPRTAGRYAPAPRALQKASWTACPAAQPPSSSHSKDAGGRGFHCLPSCPAADPTFIPLLFVLGEFSIVCSGLDSAVFHVLGEVSLPAQLPSRRPHFHSSLFLLGEFSTVCSGLSSAV